MHKSKVINLIRTFTSQEWRDFLDFVNSPYFNRNRDIIRMVKYLNQHFPTFNSGTIAKPKLSSFLYPSENYNDKRIRYIMSDLYKLAERFLLIQRYENRKDQMQIDLLNSYLDRSLEKQYQTQRRKIKASDKGLAKKSSAHHFFQLQLADTEEKHFELKRQRRFDANIQTASEHLDCFYFIKKLKYSCGMQDRQRLLSAQYEDNLSDDFLKIIQQNDFFENAVVRAYYSVLMALREEEKDKHFHNLKELLADQQELISKPDLREIYLYAINYCARKIRQGKDIYLSEALSLYQQGISNQILIENGELSPWTFTNVVKLALRLRRYDWIEIFIKSNSKKLPDSFRQNALNYNLAELYYYRKSYDQALEYLNLVKFSDLNYYLGSRVMLIKIYYEREEEQALLSQLAAFSMFLKRNKEISSHIKKTYLNFCDLLFQLVKRNPRQLLNIGERIQQTSPLTDKGWLIQQYEEI